MKIVKSIFVFLLVISILSTQIGCSMVVPGKQRFSVTASETDAKIYVNGDYLGIGNVQTRVSRNHDVFVLVKKEGFNPVSKNIGTEFSITGILDIVGGFFILFPLMGLFFPGARQLEQTNVAVTLEKA